MMERGFTDDTSTGEEMMDAVHIECHNCHHDKDLHHNDIRKVAKQVADYINNHGGWTIIGSICTGKVCDAISDPSSNDIVKSLEPHLHILYL